jgi:hypothetical protein
MPDTMHSDMKVVVVAEQMPAKGKAGVLKTVQSRLPPWLQNRRNQALAGAGLLALVLIPIIVAPAVVSSRRNRHDAFQSKTSVQARQWTMGAAAPRSVNDVVPETPKPFIAVKDGQVWCNFHPQRCIASVATAHRRATANHLPGVTPSPSCMTC